MILQDPSQLPTPDPTPDDENNEKPQRGSSVIFGSLIVDGFVQMFMTWWFTWILRAGIAFTSYNPWLWWAGTTLMYVTLHWQNHEMAGKFFIKHLQLFLLFTALIFIFK